MQNIRHIFPLRHGISFSGAALIIWSFLTFPDRSIEIRALSALTILAFFLLLGQFLCTRRALNTSSSQTLCNLFKLHISIGYIALVVIVLHPLFLVYPKFGGEALAPGDALFTIFTNFSNPGIASGVIAWIALLLIGISSFFRKLLGLQYRAWKLLHIILASLFTVASVYHVTHLGRHANLLMTCFIISYAIYCCYAYFRQSNATPNKNKKIEL